MRKQTTVTIQSIIQRSLSGDRCYQKVTTFIELRTADRETRDADRYSGQEVGAR